MDFAIRCFLLWFCLVRYIHADGCDNSPMDIVIVLDTSYQYRSTNLIDEKQFLFEMVKRLYHDNNHIGLITYADSAQSQFQLNSYTTPADINMAVQYMWASTGKSETTLAIEYAMQHGFSQSAGDRVDVPNVIILVTHTYIGGSAVDFILQNQLQERMIELFAIKIGSNSSGNSFLSVIENEDNILACPSTNFLVNKTSQLIPLLCKARGTLKPWGKWTPCGTTCGPSIKRRFKECVKRKSQETCDGIAIEESACTQNDCTEPVNGGWTYWEKWSSCSKTCDNGSQTRRRYCTAPKPLHGGRFCQGSETQTKECADWSCPDCTRACPSGGNISANCECLCGNDMLTGIIQSNTNRPLGNVKVYLKSNLYQMITATDDEGTFNISGICIEREIIALAKDGYVSEKYSPVRNKINSKHWTLKVKMTQYVPPVFIQQPQNKVRFVGQSIALCCKANGVPVPNKYTWLKNGNLLYSNNGTLELANLEQSDSGTYVCSVETAAGISLSDEAAVYVNEGNATCQFPKAFSTKLPDDCYYNDNGNNVSLVNTGKCSRESCASTEMNYNGSCTETWDEFCCDDGEVENIDIICSDFVYKLTKIKTCRCAECTFKTVIEGNAYGKFANGTQLPFSYGYLYIHGQKYSVTNKVGHFRFNVRFNFKRLVVRFVDEIFKKFVDTVKVFTVSKGESTFVNVILPLKPNPIIFNTNIGLNVPLGQSNNMSPAGSLSIPDQSIITKNGKVFRGTAKATVHFMDPRKFEDLETANGEFVYETDDGTKGPLDTFGMFHVAVEDLSGNPLKINKPMQFSLDASTFNISLDKDGNPDLSLWSYDDNKGIWIETAKMQFASPVSGSRRLLDQVLVGDFSQMDIPPINLMDEEPVWDRVIIGYTNCDHSVPIYANRIVTHKPVVKRYACFVSVSVYTDLTFNSTDGPGTNIVAVSKEKYGNKFKGVASKSTDKDGHACLSIFCDSKVFIYAESKHDGTRMTASKTHDLPKWYNSFKNTKSSTEIEIGDAQNIESVLDDGQTRYSPILYYEDQKKCEQDFERNYKFQFAYFTYEDSLDTTVRKDSSKEMLSWYPISQKKPYSKSCFLKIAMKVPDVDIRIIATSYQNTTKPENRYGTHVVRPIYDRLSNDTTIRGACIEYRCAGYVIDDKHVSYDVPTIVQVNLATKKNCKLSILSTSLDVIETYAGRGFIFKAIPGLDYGPEFGVYVNNGDANKVRNFCSSGTDTGNVGKSMKPKVNAAVEFQCI